MQKFSKSLYSKLVNSSWLIVHGEKQKNYEPTNQLTNNHRGFTLIELLVVITLIAVLTSIAISTYSGIQSKGRDTKRKADIDEVRKALETYATAGIAKPYLAPAGNMFSDNVVPRDPKNTGIYVYTLSTENSSGPTVQPWTSLGQFTTYTVCSRLENKGGNSTDNNGSTDSNLNGDFYCRKNIQ